MPGAGRVNEGELTLTPISFKDTGLVSNTCKFCFKRRKIHSPLDVPRPCTSSPKTPAIRSSTLWLPISLISLLSLITARPWLFFDLLFFLYFFLIIGLLSPPTGPVLSTTIRLVVCSQEQIVVDKLYTSVQRSTRKSHSKKNPHHSVRTL